MKTSWNQTRIHRATADMATRVLALPAVLLAVVIAVSGCKRTTEPARPGKAPSGPDVSGGKASPVEPQAIGELVAEFNRGAALMEQ